MRQQGGGLLARLFRRGNQRGPMSPFGPAIPRNPGSAVNNSGGILKAISNPNAVSGFLSNTQKVLNTAQQIGPLVQQYGPLVRNLPAMWKLYKGFKDIPSEKENSNDGSEENKSEKKATKEEPSQRQKEKKKRNIPVQEDDDHENTVPTRSNGQSVPKLYI
jgi:Sec-independent protein translocase protein TatA